MDVSVFKKSLGTCNISTSTSDRREYSIYVGRYYSYNVTTVYGPQPIPVEIKMDYENWDQFPLNPRL